jgi:carboxyl-terminal processing protease
VTRFRVPAATLLAVTLAVALASAQVPDAAATFDSAWTIIRDSHFDRTMNGLDWNAVRAELRPRAVAASSTGELRRVLRDMLQRLGLSHFALIPSTVEVSGDAEDLAADPGFDVRLVDDELLVTRVDPQVAQVHPGWRVVQIGTTKVADLIHALPGSRSSSEGHGGGPEGGAGGNDRLLNVEAWRIAQTRLRGPAGSRAEITFEDGTGRLVALALERRPDVGQPVTVGNLPTMFVRVENERRQTPRGGTAGIIRFNVWMTAVDGPFQRAMDEYRSADGIIIDLRGNPGGLAAMMMGIAGHFMTDRQPLGVMKTRDNEPLRFVANPRLVSAAGLPVQPFAGPVAILVDAMSGSASECFTGGMQSLKRARVFGQTSMGQALPALFQRLPNGDLMIHAYGDFVTSDGTRLEGRGVVPDEILPLRREDLLAGRDRTLDAALAWIDQARAAGKPQHP